MNKALIIFAAGLMLTACGNSAKKAEEARIADSIAEQRIADSIAQVEQERQLEQAREDSIAGAMYDNAISISKGKERISETWPPSESFNITVPVTVTNNTDVTLTPDDYTITYSERLEYSDGDGYEDTPKSMKGPELAPGGSASVTLYGQNITGIAKVKVKKNISAEEFKARRAQK